MGPPATAGTLLVAPSRRAPLEDRREAGRELVTLLAPVEIAHPIVLAIPRGGAVVAEELARGLGAERDLLVARKVGAPHNPEYGLGAVAEGGVRFLDRARVREARLSAAELEPRILAEVEEVARRAARYRSGRARTSLGRRNAILVDDGVATGGTAVAAIRSARIAGAASVTVALGVCPPSTAAQLSRLADRVAAVLMPSVFEAVGQWYRSFAPVEDTEVLRFLAGS